MTTTAYDDQYTPAGGFSSADLDGFPVKVIYATQASEQSTALERAYTQGRKDERAELVALLMKHGYREVAPRNKAGEHLA